MFFFRISTCVWKQQSRFSIIRILMKYFINLIYFLEAPQAPSFQGIPQAFSSPLGAHAFGSPMGAQQFYSSSSIGCFETAFMYFKLFPLFFRCTTILSTIDVDASIEYVDACFEFPWGQWGVREWQSADPNSILIGLQALLHWGQPFQPLPQRHGHRLVPRNLSRLQSSWNRWTGRDEHRRSGLWHGRWLWNGCGLLSSESHGVGSVLPWLVAIVIHFPISFLVIPVLITSICLLYRVPTSRLKEWLWSVLMFRIAPQAETTVSN